MLVITTYNLDRSLFDLTHTPNFAKRLREAGIELDDGR
jgi:hypothetical protein